MLPDSSRVGWRGPARFPLGSSIPSPSQTFRSVPLLSLPSSSRLCVPHPPASTAYSATGATSLPPPHARSTPRRRPPKPKPPRADVIGGPLRPGVALWSPVCPEYRSTWSQSSPTLSSSSPAWSTRSPPRTSARFVPPYQCPSHRDGTKLPTSCSMPAAV
jgi:hypothetical protein